MKITAFTVFIITVLISCNLYAQQDFAFRYNFKKLIHNDPQNFFRVDTATVNGKFTTTYIPLKVKLNELKGGLKKTSDITGDTTQIDTFYIRLWPLNNRMGIDSAGYLSEKDNYKNFVIFLRKEDWNSFGVPGIKRFKAIDLPYHGWQLFALNIPFRVNIKDGSSSSDFINANVSCSIIMGKQRIFKTEFVKPRNRYIGVGLYTGFGQLTRDENKYLGLNYGANLIGSIFNVNLIGTIGFETRLSHFKDTKPYVGLGFGISLFSLTGGTPAD